MERNGEGVCKKRRKRELCCDDWCSGLTVLSFLLVPGVIYILEHRSLGTKGNNEIEIVRISKCEFEAKSEFRSLVSECDG